MDTCTIYLQGYIHSKLFGFIKKNMKPLGKLETQNHSDAWSKTSSAWALVLDYVSFWSCLHMLYLDTSYVTSTRQWEDSAKHTHY